MKKVSSLGILKITQRICFGLDIGGTLTKVVYFEPEEADDIDQESHEARLRIHQFITSSKVYGSTGQRDQNFEHYSTELVGNLHFIRFETRRIESFVSIVKSNNLASPSFVVGATGGGAIQFDDKFKPLFFISKYDELACLLKGINFMVRNAPGECYYWKAPSFEETCTYDIEKDKTYPYLVVNIGSGVSILKVEGEGKYHRVGGSSLGGGTFYGLCRLLTGCESYKEAMDLADNGHSTNVDMLVKDIYGGDYKQLNISGDAVASSFGKMVRPENEKSVSIEDKARGALVMITNNIGSIVQLHAKLEGVDKIFFVGTFLHANTISMKKLAYAVDWWSQGNVKALFLKHKGYFGAVGAMLNSMDQFHQQQYYSNTQKGSKKSPRNYSLSLDSSSNRLNDISQKTKTQHLPPREQDEI